MMTPEQIKDMQTQIERLKADLAKAKTERGRELTLKVSEKGALAVYGLQRFPVTLYLSQWEKVIKLIKEGTLEKFISEHSSEFTSKDQSKAA